MIEVSFILYTFGEHYLLNVETGEKWDKGIEGKDKNGRKVE